MVNSHKQELKDISECLKMHEESLHTLYIRLNTIAASIGTEPPSPEIPCFNLSQQFRPEDYFTSIQPKKLIVLHHTAGTTVEGAVNHWKNQAEKIGTAFIIDYSGEIYKIFPPNCWAYHTGRGTKVDSTSIGIELVNEGPLVEKDGKFFWWPGGFTRPLHQHPSNIYSEKVNWRGYKHWMKYTDAQYGALNRLLPYLCSAFDIPLRRLPSPTVRTLPTSVTGITDHSALRDDKTDLSPAFNWDRLKLS